MKKNFKEQFENLRNIIKINVDTLQGLLNQSESLSKIICSLDDKPENTAIKQQLEESRAKIRESIDILAVQANELFETYQNLVEEVFGKQ